MKKAKIFAIALIPMAIGMLASCGGNNDNPDPGPTKEYKVTEEEWNASFGKTKTYYIADNYYSKFIQSVGEGEAASSMTSEAFVDGAKLHLKGVIVEGGKTNNEESYYNKKETDFDEYYKDDSGNWKVQPQKENPMNDFASFFAPYVYKNFQYDVTDHTYKCDSGHVQGIGDVKNLKINFEDKKVVSMSFDATTTQDGKEMNGSVVGTFTYGGQTVTLPQIEPVSNVFTYTINSSEQKALTMLSQEGMVGYFSYENVAKDDIISFYVNGTLITENISADDDSNIVPNGEPGQFVAINDFTPEEGVPSFGMFELDGGFVVNGGQNSPTPETNVRLMGLNGDFEVGQSMQPVSEGSLEYVIHYVSVTAGTEIKIKNDTEWIDTYKRGGNNNALDLNLAYIVEGGNAKFIVGGSYNIYFNSDKSSGDQYGVFIELDRIPSTYSCEGIYSDQKVTILSREFVFNKVDLDNNFVEYKSLDTEAISGIEYKVILGDAACDFTYETPAEIADKFSKGDKALIYTGTALGLDIYLKVDLTDSSLKLWVEEHVEFVYDLTIHADASQISWAFNDVDLFVYAIDAFNTGTWVKATLNSDVLNVTVPNRTVKFLVTRCVIGTETPDWGVTSGHEPGRIYDKSTPDTQLVKGLGEYTVTFQHYGEND